MTRKFKVGDRIKLNPNTKDQYPGNVEYMTYEKEYVIEREMEDSDGLPYCIISLRRGKWHVYTRHIMKAGVSLK